MKSTHLIDPETLQALEFFPPFEIKPEDLPKIRAQFEALTVVLPLPAGIVRDERYISGEDGAPDVRVLIYTPERCAASAPALLHIHGGGFMLGSPDMTEPRNAMLASDLECVVVSVDYRLAPETRAPGNVKDCYAALRWMHTKAEELGIDTKRIGIIGESGGGGLAATLAIFARDRAEFPIALQVLIYPMLDDRTGLGEWSSYCGEYIWTTAANQTGWQCLLGEKPGGPNVSPYAAAARVETVAGLPPTFISVGALDLFLEEDLTYAQRLAAAGVPIELHVYPGAIHAFDVIVDAGVSKRFLDDLKGALRRGL